MKKFPFKSSSSDTTHWVTVDDDGIVTCSCTGWIHHRKCWHTTDVMKELGITKATPDARAEIATQASLLPVPTGFIEPMLASGHKKPITEFGSDWVMEEKYDGHRLIIKVAYREAFAWSRNGIARATPTLMKSLNRLAEGTYDSELFIPGGFHTDVADLQRSEKAVIRIFDILKVKDENVMPLALNMRRPLLEEACGKLHPDGLVQIAPQVKPSDFMLRKIWDRGGEGAIVKHVHAVYEPGRRVKTWLKFKREETAVLTVVGFEEGELGPHSKILLMDEDGNKCSVKALNDHWRDVFSHSADLCIGKPMRISYQHRTRDGKYAGPPRADHFLEGPLA